MEHIFSQLDRIAERVKRIEEHRKVIAEKLRNVRFENFLEDKISILVKKIFLDNLRFIGVDGGIVKKSYHSIDIILSRAVGVIFDYKQDKLERVGYFPSPSPTPKIKILENYSETDFNYMLAFERLKAELEILQKSFEKNPTIVLADGELIPHPSDKPPKSSPVYKEYENVIKMYKELYKKSKGFLLAGVIEDSRSCKVCELLKPLVSDIEKDVLSKTRDTNLLFYLLNPGERSFVYNLVHPDLKESSTHLYSFYLKTTEFDRPLKVEFYCEGDPIETANKIASLVYSVSSLNQEYGIPSVLIEADSRAKLSEKDIETIYSHLINKTGDISALYQLRRNKRPF